VIVRELRVVARVLCGYGAVVGCYGVMWSLGFCGLFLGCNIVIWVIWVVARVLLCGC